ncbi:MAG: glycosyltransferase family 4 protein [Sulfurimonas sp.]|nr:glycosyltransferase family 4 protein [Sulfurimonas sp.]
MKNKHILEFCLAHGFGGLELCVVDYFKCFQTKTKCSLMVAPDTKLDKSVDDKNKFTLKRNKLLPFLPALKLAKFIDTNDVDIIHFHWGKDIVTVVLGKLLSKRKPKIIHSRHMSMTRFKDDMYHNWLYKNIDILHAVTNQVKEQMQKFIPDFIRPPIEVVYLGVNEPKVDKEKIDQFKEKYKIKENEFIVGMVGRIESEKGQYILIDAIKKLQNLNIKALIIGHTMDENYLDKLKTQIKSLNLQNNIIFTGFTRDVNEHMQLCDTMVLATKKETFGLVVIEAMANKICMIATNNGGPLEIIDDNINGLLFDRTSDDLAKKIEFLYNDTDKKEALAQAGYEKVKKVFDHDTQVEKLYDIIDKC